MIKNVLKLAGVIAIGVLALSLSTADAEDDIAACEKCYYGGSSYSCGSYICRDGWEYYCDDGEWDFEGSCD